MKLLKLRVSSTVNNRFGRLLLVAFGPARRQVGEQRLDGLIERPHIHPKVFQPTPNQGHPRFRFSFRQFSSANTSRFGSR